ncbi:MAG: polyphosphate kinase 1 [Clostridia bacterium]|nr:polyphosphate kinase 1 [Clostridia bacterium]
MSNKEIIFKQNRERSWLKFNERVLEEAYDDDMPILERIKFISIYSTNLDEFFMIRVGSLWAKSVYTPNTRDDKSNLTPKEQLENIYRMVRSLNIRYNESCNLIKTLLRHRDIFSLDYSELAKTEKEYIENYFQTNIRPILSPQIVDIHHPFPFIDNKRIYITSILKTKKDNRLFGIIALPDTLPKFVVLPGNNFRYILIEKIIYHYIDEIFNMYKTEEKNIICVTRNADISPEDDSDNETADFRKQMQKLLHLRKKLAPVRLETNFEMSNRFSKYICEKLEITENQCYVVNSSLNMKYIFSLVKTIQEKRPYLVHEKLKPVDIYKNTKSMIEKVNEHDILLHYPYESMKPFLRLIKQAANDKDVISIKITIYRLAFKATLVDYLCSAAENGKDVTVIIELRARFDEQNNIDWSKKLEDAGCRIIYGFEEYKVHSKVCLITYKKNNRLKYITQIGTGNYNESTAEQYTDLCYITANREIGEDANLFFTNMAIGNHDGDYKHLLVAPLYMKNKIVELIDEEIKKGKNGKIFFKVNSVTDIKIINKLREASENGVQIVMVVRGITCILPGIENYTENLQVRSIVGRFLEHSRIYSFGQGDSQKIYISSADLMTRNLNRRVEVACPIYTPYIKRKLNNIIEYNLKDNKKARILNSNGNYVKINHEGKEFVAQEEFIEQAKKLEPAKKVNKRSFVRYLKNFFKKFNKKYK